MLWQGISQSTQPRPARRTLPAAVAVLGAVLVVASTLAVATPAVSAEPGCDPSDPVTCTLAELADLLGFRIGSTAEHFEVGPGPYAETLAREFNAVTPENALKLYATQASRGVWTFAHADAVVDFAEEHGLEVRGHTLVWSQDQYPPQWIKDITDPDELRAVLAEHIERVMTRYRDRIHRWDVVNEPLEALGTGPADSVIVRLLGPGTDWIVEQFATAHLLDPDAELWINEFGTDLIPGKHEAFLELVTELVEADVPLHGVGLQTHRFTVNGPDPDVFRGQLEDYTALGLEVAITELDVVTQPDDPLALERQAEAYGRIVGACLAVDGCNEVTTWNLSDADSWLDNLLGFPTRPTLFDEDFVPKPAYHTVRQLLADAVLALPSVDSGSVAGSVTDLGGAPLAGAVVMVAVPGDASSLQTTTTDAAGAYHVEGLTPGAVVVRASHHSATPVCYPTAVNCVAAEIELVDVAVGSATAGLDLVLPPASGGSISGTVTDGQGNGMAGVRVWVFGSGFATTSLAITGADGDYSVAALGDGTYFVWFDAPGTGAQCYQDAPCTWAGAVPNVVAAGGDLVGRDAVFATP
ncbi:MAG: endo-1,4-beta-xylanase [Acidimicrobiia bacterium]|nr:endo-1,4-beta-xylanase [Acidimicrobiia bacterium]